MIRVSLVGVRVEVPTNQPIVLLREEDGERYLPIFIGPPEATAIVYALQGMETPRPMTHDLFTTVLSSLSTSLQRVEITKLEEGTFFAEIELLAPNGDHDKGSEANDETDHSKRLSRISSRPSDAIALAVRAHDEVPIFVDEAVLDEAGVVFDDEDEDAQVEEFREFLDTVVPEDFAQ